MSCVKSAGGRLFHEAEPLTGGPVLFPKLPDHIRVSELFVSLCLTKVTLLLT